MVWRRRRCWIKSCSCQSHATRKKRRGDDSTNRTDWFSPLTGKMSEGQGGRSPPIKRVQNNILHKNTLPTIPIPVKNHQTIT